MSVISDQNLLARYASGDEEALAELVHRYLPMIYRLVFSYTRNQADAEDVTQTVFVKMWRHWRQFDPERNFKNWLLAIAKHAALDFCRRQRTAPINLSDEEYLVEILSDPALPVSERLDRNWRNQALERAIDSLVGADQTVIRQYHQQGLNFREIALQTGESINTVKSRYRRAVVKLRKKLPGNV